MCGIAGIIKLKSAQNLNETIQKMVNALSHRGPDDHHSCLVFQERLALGHARLSIQDLSQAGRQPLADDKTGNVIVFNGEIYNFISLRSALEKEHAIEFKGHSDTEVLLQLLVTYGIEQTLKKINGMFAFAYYDRRNSKLYLVRDRLGEKPLYYGIANGSFMFASELKAFQNNDASINYEILGSYLKYGYIPSPYSIYTGIFKLSPGKYIELDLMNVGKLSPASLLDCLPQKSYWSLYDVYDNRQVINDETEVLERLEDLLISSTREKLVSDVPVGAFLSGGVDSSAVSALMQSLSSNPIKTFTIGFTEKEFNEAPYAKDISNHLGTDHTEVTLEPSMVLERVNDIPQYFDEPYADPSCLPAYLVSQIAREQVTVCLSGDGGDELFAGYNRYLWTEKIFEKQKYLPQSLRHTLSHLISRTDASKLDTLSGLFLSDRKRSANMSAKLSKIGRLLVKSNRNEIYEDLISFNAGAGSLLTGSNESNIFHPGITGVTTDFLDYALLYDQLMYLPEDNLTKVDRTSMAHSLETRLPLLDYRVVEFSWNIPRKFKINNSSSKWALRKILYKYVPKELIERPKMGFSVPLREWLKGPLRQWSQDHLDDLCRNQNDIFNQTQIKRLWAEHQRGKRDHSLPLWSLLMYQSWHASL